MRTHAQRGQSNGNQDSNINIGRTTIANYSYPKCAHQLRAVSISVVASAVWHLKDSGMQIGIPKYLQQNAKHNTKRSAPKLILFVDFENNHPCESIV